LGSYPFGHQAYPGCPPPGFSGDRRFGVCQDTDGFLRLNAQTVALPHGPTSTETQLRLVSRGTSYSRPRLAFHPYAQVNRVICTSTSVRPSTHLSVGFGRPRHRSTGFGARTHDSSRAHDAPRPLRGCALVAFATASHFKWLTSPWIRTPWPVFQNGRYDAAPSLRTSSLPRR